MRLHLVYILIFIVSSLSYTQGDKLINFNESEYFNIGMFSVVGHMPNVPQPGSMEFREDLQKMYNGTSNNSIAINTVQAYGYYIADLEFWETCLSDISSVSDSLKCLGDCQFYYVDANNDSMISQSEIDTLKAVFENFLSLPNTDHIAGWYIADEPSAHEYDPAEVAKIYAAIKQLDDRPIYIAEAPGEADYSKFVCDILIIDNYYYTLNNYTNLGTLAWWSELITGARDDLRVAGREETEIHALLVLGEEIFPDSLNESVMASHGLTHSAIRRVLELGVEGVWFYAWRAGVIDSEDAVHRWLEQEYYAEAVETEFYDTDNLVTVLSSDFESEIIISDIANGQSPIEGLIFNYYDRIAAISSGDFQGSDELIGNPVLYDLSYEIENGFRSNGDGDDELITAYESGEVYFNESGILPDEVLIGSLSANIIATASGDFDGDGDDELITALQIDDQCFIYLSDDASTGSVIQYELFSSDQFVVTALTAGDFNENGRDELASAITNSSGGNSYIYIDDVASTGSAISGSPWYGPDNNMIVNSMAAGDFTDDNDYSDFLIIATSSPDFQQTRIYTTQSDSFSFDSSYLFFGPDDNWNVTSMVFGDFNNDFNSRKDLIIALITPSNDQINMYRTGNPLVNGIGNLIYDSGIQNDYSVSSMTSANFRESNHPTTSSNEDGFSETNKSSAQDFTLYQNYPNPFNPTTSIQFTVKSQQYVKLKVYDVLGKEIVTLVSEEKPAGEYLVEFKPASIIRNPSSGIYFYQLQVGHYVETKKMILLK